MKLVVSRTRSNETLYIVKGYRDPDTGRSTSKVVRRLGTRAELKESLPDGTDAVVMIEDVHEEPDGFVRLFSAVSPWQNVRQVGEDLCMGDMIAPSGTLITRFDVSFLGSSSITPAPWT